MKYIQKSKPIEATQWFKNGDHPNDGPADKEGKVVRYFRHPELSLAGHKLCPKCGHLYKRHGWIDSTAIPPNADFDGDIGSTVCPGDWVVTTPEGKYYTISEQDFGYNYKPVCDVYELL